FIHLLIEIQNDGVLRPRAINKGKLGHRSNLYIVRSNGYITVDGNCNRLSLSSGKDFIKAKFLNNNSIPFVSPDRDTASSGYVKIDTAASTNTRCLGSNSQGHVHRGDIPRRTAERSSREAL